MPLVHEFHTEPIAEVMLVKTCSSYIEGTRIIFKSGKGLGLAILVHDPSSPLT